MTYAEIQTTHVGGVPYTEYRPQPEVKEKPIITIEFEPAVHPSDEYSYPQPQFTFLERVAMHKQWEDCVVNQKNLEENLDWFAVRAMELVVRQTRSGRLLEAPYWMYGLRCFKGTRELMWFSEDELIAAREMQIDKEHF